MFLDKLRSLGKSAWFLVIDNSKRILFACCCRMKVTSNLIAKAKAMHLALDKGNELNPRISYIFTGYAKLCKRWKNSEDINSRLAFRVEEKRTEIWEDRN